MYATQRHPLQKQIEKLLAEVEPASIEGDIQAVIVPDTNRLTGGHVAARVFKTLQGRQYDSVILIAPSHSGMFHRMNICSLDTYRTPLGDLVVNDALRNELCDEDDDIFLDDLGHFHTEGIDVQLPFLQTVLSGFDIVPIVMGEETPEFCRELGHAVGEIMYNRRTLVVASSDVLNGTETDLEELKQYLEAYDVSQTMSLLNSERVRMEGRGPLLVAMIAAQHRRGNRAHVLNLEPPDGAEDAPGSIGVIFYRG